jgi:hypothetical protein
VASDQASDCGTTGASRNAALTRRFPILIALLVAGCAGPVAHQAVRDREDARLTVLADAMFYWRCTHKAVVIAGECRPWREAYERDYAAFIAKYGASIR